METIHCISYRMIPSKLCFFFLQPLRGLYSVHLVLILTSSGLSINEAGFISGARFIASVFLTPFLGWLADYTKRQDIIFVVINVLMIAAYLPLPWIAVALQSHHSALFYIMLCLICVTTCCMSPTRGLIESFVMKLINVEGTTDTFSNQTLFGAFGTMTLTLLCGFLLDEFKLVGLPTFSVAVFFISALTALLIPTGYITAKQADASDVKREKKKSMFTVSKETFSKTRNIIFLISIFILGICAGGYNAFFFKLMKDQMNSTSTIMGISYGTAGAGEITVFLYGEKITQNIGNPINGLIIALLAHALRFLLPAVITNAWFMVPVQLLTGLTFGLFYLSAAECTYQIADEKIYNTVFLIVINCYINAAGVVTNFCGGYMYGSYGGSILFLTYSGLASVWVVVMIAYFVLPDLFSSDRDKNLKPL